MGMKGYVENFFSERKKNARDTAIDTATTMIFYLEPLSNQFIFGFKKLSNKNYINFTLTKQNTREQNVTYLYI